MRKIIRYSSLSWDENEWEKKLTWSDFDAWGYRGSKRDEKGNERENVVEDYHVMFALVSKTTPAKMTITPAEREMEPEILWMNTGGMVLVGNGFVYYDIRLGDVKS